jgi:hypothetical protein
LDDEALNQGATFVGERKIKGVEFSQFCFHSHLNVPTGRSSDQIKRMRPFGIFPFLVNMSPEKSRYLFAFLCSNWRFIDRLRCERYPEVCEICDRENTSVHVLFHCPTFNAHRARFHQAARKTFCFDVLRSDDRKVQSAICFVGREIYFSIAAFCEPLPNNNNSNDVPSSPESDT